MLNSGKKEIIKFENVNFSFSKGLPVLNNVSFSIFENEHLCIIGPNGCGKSTLAKLLVGLFKPQSGSIYFNGTKLDFKNIQTLKQSCGLIFENPENQFIGLSLADDIAFGLENTLVPHDQMQAKINEVAEICGISDLLTHSVKQLSGGQKQLASIASVLGTDPKIIVFDEVSCMLDSNSKKKVDKLLLSLKTNQHKTLITVTHDMEEANNADRVLVLSEGQVKAIGTPSEIFSRNDLEIGKPFTYRLADCLKLSSVSDLDKYEK